MFFGFAGILLVAMFYVSSKVPVGIANVHAEVRTRTWESGYVYAKGTWEIDGEPTAFPLNVSKILCVQSESQCYEAQAEIFNGLLDSNYKFYEITKGC